MTALTSPREVGERKGGESPRGGCGCTALTTPRRRRKRMVRVEDSSSKRVRLHRTDLSSKRRNERKESLAEEGAAVPN